MQVQIQLRLSLVLEKETFLTSTTLQQVSRKSRKMQKISVMNLRLLELT